MELLIELFWEVRESNIWHFSRDLSRCLLIGGCGQHIFVIDG